MQYSPDTSSVRIAASQASGGTSSEPVYALIERMVSQLRLRGHVLDFGAGKGHLARRLLRMECFESVTCADLMRKPAGIPEEVAWHSCDLNDPTGLPDRSFDTIISAEVIEHLENPRAVTREWFRLLKPGGWLLFSTPNNESIRSLLAMIGRGHYQAFGEASYPAHITALLRKDMERICEEAGFEMTAFRYTDHGILPKGKRLSWQHISGGKLRGLRFSDNVLAICRRSPDGKAPASA
jgi:2-polyprenyl-3-methyl-5-hydroxy-6-metoxy-1,4-benzoquinol methylase